MIGKFADVDVEGSEEIMTFRFSPQRCLPLCDQRRKHRKHIHRKLWLSDIAIKDISTYSKNRQFGFPCNPFTPNQSKQIKLYFPNKSHTHSTAPYQQNLTMKPTISTVTHRPVGFVDRDEPEPLKARAVSAHHLAFPSSASHNLSGRLPISPTAPTYYSHYRSIERCGYRQTQCQHIPII